MKLEELSARLRSLYAQYGYRPYKMSKFEEYELYAGNREFLLSDNIITFTDTDGKLMALKPDVTLSIIKNTDVDVRAGATEKLFYSENVYRVPKGAEGFREIMQTGLECIGGVDRYCVAEVLLLAAESLRATGRQYVLDVGLPGLPAEVAAIITPDVEVQGQLLQCAAEKSLHGIDAIAAGLSAGPNAVNSAAVDALKTLSGLYGTPEETLAEAERAAAGRGLEGEL
ncbi:MAG: ATP phosphoribosyltransferase regulatory subunit, partial [Clostridia bacterium]|nr:ATP phosphoribosyltransferase regulatory subunit [Clostridia bacterium]